MAIVKKAAALANMDTGYLAKDIGHEIAEAAQEIVDGKFHDQFIVDPIQGGAGTSINMNTNEVIANRALERMGYEKGEYAKISPNTHVNMAQSTNDAFPTGIHIATLMMLEELLITMEELHAAFLAKAKSSITSLKWDVRIYKMLFRFVLDKNLKRIAECLRVI